MPSSLRLVLCSLVVVAAPGCSGARGGGFFAFGDGGGGGGGDGGRLDGGGGDGGGGGGDGGDTTSVPACLNACASPAECVMPTVPGQTSAANFSCDRGACVWLGCSADADCNTAMIQNQVCRAFGAGPKVCAKACASPDDCVIAGAALYDAAHYTCESGACRWAGCFTDMECKASIGPEFVCRSSACMRGCAAVEDCVLAGPSFYDVDHWSCAEGGCIWSGCFRDQECTEAFGRSMVCR